jgi:hypothetical protein
VKDTWQWLGMEKSVIMLMNDRTYLVEERRLAKTAALNKKTLLFTRKEQHLPSSMPGSSLNRQIIFTE